MRSCGEAGFPATQNTAFGGGLQLEILVNTTERLRQSVARNDIKELLDVLQICTRNNVGGIMNEELFNKITWESLSRGQ